MPAAIVVRGLRKSYGDVQAVRGVDFDVQPGETFGFLGPNGAGKSTTIKILCTLAKATGGRRRWPASTWRSSATTYGDTSGWSSRTPPSTAT